MAAEFVVFSGKDGQTYWHLTADNGEVVAQSEGYTSKASAMNGIQAVNNVAARAGITDRTE